MRAFLQALRIFSRPYSWMANLSGSASRASKRPPSSSVAGSTAGRSTHFFLRDSLTFEFNATPVLKAVEGFGQISSLRRVQHFDKCQAAVLARLLVARHGHAQHLGVHRAAVVLAHRVDQIFDVVVAHAVRHVADEDVGRGAREDVVR